ncbi:MAG: G1 family glutamic endopeptidase [Bryobacteraceae bacterium]
MFAKPIHVTAMNRLLQAQLLGALVVLPAVAQIPDAPVSSAIATPISRHHHVPLRIHERRYDGSITSENWSGYAVTGTNVTDVKGSWIVPAVNCPAVATSPRSARNQGQQNQYAAFWVGIDGYSSSTVEQVGTDSDCDSGKPQYYAWFEFYPHPSYSVNNFPVAPNDRISAEVSYSSSTRLFTVTLTDETSGKSFSTSTSVSSAARSSAEWIAEAPSSGSGILPLADFGLVDFGQNYSAVNNTCYATVNGTANPIGSFGTNQAITMVSASGANEAVPGVLVNLASFVISWY